MTESWEQLRKTIIHKKTHPDFSLFSLLLKPGLWKKECLEKASHHPYQFSIQRSWASTKQKIRNLSLSVSQGLHFNIESWPPSPPTQKTTHLFSIKLQSEKIYEESGGKSDSINSSKLLKAKERLSITVCHHPYFVSSCQRSKKWD